MKIITSLQNPLIKELKKHQSAHTRKKEVPLIFVEGKRACEPFLHSSHFTLHTLLCTQEMVAWADEQKVSDDLIVQTSTEIIKTLSTATSPSGLIGIFAPIQPKADTPLGTALVLAELQDPGNVGTLLRTATAFGIECIMLGGVSPYHPKVIQSSAGALAHAKIRLMSWQELLKKAQHDSADLIALVPEGGVPLRDLPTSSKRSQLIIVGNEAHGIPEQWIKESMHQATIPIQDSTESLNAAIAGAIALYHITQIKGA